MTHSIYFDAETSSNGAVSIVVDGIRQIFVGAEEPQLYLPVGDVIEAKLGGDIDLKMGHIFHIHVNPYQLQEEPTDELQIMAPDYFQKGDWHDSFRIMPQNVTVRWQTDVFTGDVMYHCHYLEHEDEGARQTLVTDLAPSHDPRCHRAPFSLFVVDRSLAGMIAFLRITGQEGTVYRDAEKLDPTCYRGAFSRASAPTSERALLP